MMEDTVMTLADLNTAAAAHRHPSPPNKSMLLGTGHARSRLASLRPPTAPGGRRTARTPPITCEQELRTVPESEAEEQDMDVDVDVDVDLQMRVDELVETTGDLDADENTLHSTHMALAASAHTHVSMRSAATADPTVARLVAELQALKVQNQMLQAQLDARMHRDLTVSSELYAVGYHQKTQKVRLHRTLSSSTAEVLSHVPYTHSPQIVEDMIALFSSHPAQNLPYLESSSFAQDLMHLAKRAGEVFSQEERLLQLYSPVYIFGDIHGNMQDLQFFTDNLWSFGVNLTAGTFLFLGDYVDRGQQSLEVVAYLFALKLHAPNKVFLLRGNHELRKVNGWEDWYKSASFLWQCKHRFGDAVGVRVWEVINDAFDCMPLAAVVDGTVFCVHGGIPRPIADPAAATARAPQSPAAGWRGDASYDSLARSGASYGSESFGESQPPASPVAGRTPVPVADRRLDAIRAVPCPLRLDGVSETTVTHAATIHRTFSMRGSKTAVELTAESQFTLPSGSSSYSPTSYSAAPAAPHIPPEVATQVAMDMLWADPAPAEAESSLDDTGFGPGERGGDSVQFGNAAIEYFMRANNLKLIVRAHQATATGIGISKAAKVFTVFSTSKDHGCGSSATCGCLLIEGGRVLPMLRSTKPTVRPSS